MLFLGFLVKKSAVVSHRPALHGHLFFCDQNAVDEYVAEEGNIKETFQVYNYVLLHLENLIQLFIVSCRIAAIFLLEACCVVQPDIIRL